MTAIPESTFSRSRGTTAATCPSARASTSSEYSAPGRSSCTSCVPSRSSASSSARRSSSRIPREPLPERGLTITGSATAAGSNASSATTVAGHAHVVAAALVQRPLVEARGERLLRAPARASRPPRRTRRVRARVGSSSLSTVGTTTSIASRRQRASRSSAKRGSSPRGRIERRSGSTRYRPAANGSMSPASIVTGSSSMARRIEMPDGPPAPVTRTRGVSAGIEHPLGELGGLALAGAGERRARRCRAPPRAARRSAPG